MCAAFRLIGDANGARTGSDRGPIIHCKLGLAVFAADIAEAVFNANDRGARGNMQDIYHVDMTTMSSS